MTYRYSGYRVGDGILPLLDPLPERLRFALGIGNTSRPAIGCGNPMRDAVAVCVVPEALCTQPLCPDFKDPSTQLAGLQKRLMRVLPEPEEGLLGEFEAFVDSQIASLPVLDHEPDFEAWVSRGPWNESQQDQLRTVWQQFWMSDWNLRRGLRRKLAKVDPFVKREFYSSAKHARFINASSPRFKVASCPWFHEMEEVVYGRKVKGVFENALNTSWFIKHVPVKDRPALVAKLEGLGRRFYATDFTSFEASFSRKLMLACECRLYRHMLRKFPKVAELICTIIAGQRRGKTRQGVFFSREAGRMSGDGCTSLGNGFTNMMLLKFWAYKQGSTVQGFVEGDDGLFTSDYAGDLAGIHDFMLRLGFDLKVVESDTPLGLSFCGILSANENEIIRDPLAFLEKFFWSFEVQSGHARQMTLLRSKALSACFETPHCPIVRAVADWALAKTGVSGAVDTRSLSYHLREAGTTVKNLRGSAAEAQATSPETRELFSRLFGISAGDQVTYEAMARRGDFTFVEQLELQRYSTEGRDGASAFDARMRSRAQTKVP